MIFLRRQNLIIFSSFRIPKIFNFKLTVLADHLFDYQTVRCFVKFTLNILMFRAFRETTLAIVRQPMTEWDNNHSDSRSGNYVLVGTVVIFTVTLDAHYTDRNNLFRWQFACTLPLSFALNLMLSNVLSQIQGQIETNWKQLRIQPGQWRIDCHNVMWNSLVFGQCCSLINL